MVAQLALLVGPAHPHGWREAHACAICGEIDSGGTRGPRMLLGEPGFYFMGDTRRFCAKHAAELWADWMARQPRIAKRRREIERWRRGDYTIETTGPVQGSADVQVGLFGEET